MRVARIAGSALFGLVLATVPAFMPAFVPGGARQWAPAWGQAADPARAPVAPAVPPTPIAFDDAVLRAATDLFTKANIPAGRKIELVIDPLIDGISGAQSTATRAMEQRLVELVRQSFPRFEVLPFTAQSLAKNPVMLIGTFTAVNNAGIATGPRDAYRVCLALADLQSRTIVSKGVARAKPEGIDVSPTPYYADIPMWAKDAATEAYVKTCQGTKLGDTIDPVYAERLLAGALISDGIQEYDARRYREALAFYRQALKVPGGDQLRSRNGIYLTNWKLGRGEDATDAFGDLVDYGLGGKQLSVKLLFKPGSTQFMDQPQISGPYPMWLSQIATRTMQRNACLEIVGHTSRTGLPQVNERLSMLRAQFVKDLLQTGDPDSGSRLIATGVGFSQNLIGTGKDDASDALDRRVEFKVIGC